MATLDGYNTTHAALLNLVQSQLAQFIGKADQFDDITMMAVKREAQYFLGGQTQIFG